MKAFFKTIAGFFTHLFHRTNQKIKHTKRSTKIEIAIFVCAIGFLTVGSFLIWAATLSLPNLDSFSERKVSESTKIYDKTGTVLLYDVYQDIRRTVIPYDQISPFIKNATVSIEDANFYNHNGIEIKSILRAILVNFSSLGYSQGGSTITQQVVKNSLLTKDKTITRKLKEWVLSLKLEKVLTKDQILGTYLNEAPYGGSVYGVQEASKTYFGKDAKDVTLAEAAFLAALPQAPSYYSPYGSHKKELIDRKNTVLQKMRDNGYITDEQLAAAKNETVQFKPQEDSGIKAPHFVLFIKDYIEKKYGETAATEGGLKVITTLDYDLQSKAEAIVKKWALKNATTFNASNASLVAIDPKTGGIFTMVGSRDYFDKQIDGNYNIATAERQPGSSFKPFVYATAFNEGYRPETVLFDLKTQFSTNCAADNFTSDNGCYSPSNYDGKFRGPVSMREALAQSLNIPAVKTLYLVGIQNALTTAQNMGITTLTDPSRYGLTLVLGGGEVSLLDMTSAYSVFANEGIRHPYTGIISITDKDGNVLESIDNTVTVNQKNVLPQNTARQISSILNDEQARIPEFGARSALYFEGRDVAVKTGTTNDYRDAWIIGYTPSVAVGAWAGNNDNSPMEKKIAGFIVAPMWHEVMEEFLKVVPNEKFTPPDTDTTDAPPVIRGFWQGGKTYTIDTVSGKLATEYTPKETLKEIPITDVHSILYWIDKDKPLEEKSGNPGNDPQFRLWEYPVRLWAAQQGYQTQTDAIIPVGEDTVHTADKIPTISLSINGGVLNNSSTPSFSKNTPVTVQTQINAFYPITKGDIYINDRYYGPLSGSSFTFAPNDLGDSIKAFNDIRVVITDNVANTAEGKISFIVDGAQN